MVDPEMRHVLKNIDFRIKGITYKIKFRFGVYAFQDPPLRSK